MVFLFEILQNTIPETVWEQGVHSVPEGQNCTKEFHVFIVDFGLAFLGDLS